MRIDRAPAVSTGLDVVADLRSFEPRKDVRSKRKHDCNFRSYSQRTIDLPDFEEGRAATPTRSPESILQGGGFRAHSQYTKRKLRDQTVMEGW